MTRNTDDATSARRTRATPKPLTRLSADEISRRVERKRPAIARRKAGGPAVDGGEHDGSGPDGTDTSEAVSPMGLAPGRQGLGDEANAGLGVVEDPRQDSGPSTQDPSPEAVTGCPEASGVRQMVVWEATTDAEVISGWVAASTRGHGHSVEPETGSQTGESAGDSGPGSASWRIAPVAPAVGQQPRRARLRQVGTRDDPYLVQRVRAAVVDLVLEHPHFSDETDRRLTALGIRFGVWTLNRTGDGEFDPFRDLTEDRITGFVGDARGLSPGSRDSYAAALRRLAAGPTRRHRGARRMAAEPISARVEEGLWAAAEGFAPTSWRHQEAKTLLALTFGAGALPEEINLVAPQDVLVDHAHGEPRVSVRLLRERTWVRDVPVLEPHYATWLAHRAAEVTGHSYLFKPDRVDRRNAINATTRHLTEANQAFQRFRPNAARNTWAARWLQAGVPFAAWANAAGVGPGTHLPTDLLAHLPTPVPTEVDHAFRTAAHQFPKPERPDPPVRRQRCR